MMSVSVWRLTVKDPESLQTEEEQQQHHVQNQII